MECIVLTKHYGKAGEPPIPEEEREHNDDEKTQAPQILRNLSFSHKA